MSKIIMNNDVALYVAVCIDKTKCGKPNKCIIQFRNSQLPTRREGYGIIKNKYLNIHN